ncbi:COX assembly mitochondrial protein homolog isoform X2 [Callithrix jacchus]
MALDPAEQHLRHVEKDVLIPKKMREKARERCSEQIQDFTKCCQDSGVLMVIKCRKENSALKECLTAYYTDPAFYEECKMEYLKEREEFRRTGIPAKKRLQKLPTSIFLYLRGLWSATSLKHDLKVRISQHQDFNLEPLMNWYFHSSFSRFICLF